MAVSIKADTYSRVKICPGKYFPVVFATRTSKIFRFTGDAVW